MTTSPTDAHAVGSVTSDEPVKTFADLGVDAAICAALGEADINNPFPIQELTLPLALSGADVIGQARTGTGKTLAFGIPLLQKAEPRRGLQALVIVPTRELCLQVAEDLSQASAHQELRVVAVFGGRAIGPQADALADGCEVVVGTPGRLLDLSRRGILDLSSVTSLVLDEADEMLDLGFLPDVEQLIGLCSTTRQTLLFSATMPSAVVALARRYMDRPTFLRADVEEVLLAPATRQYLFSCHRMDKPAVLARILSAPDRGLTLVFCRTKRMCDVLAEELRERDIDAAAIHSDLRQEARERVMDRFRKGKVTTLVATDVAARGLDIDDVTHVINYDCPDDEKTYLHRIGRTGRAGAKGVAVTLAVWNELARLEMIRRELDIAAEVNEVFSTSPLLEELFDLPPLDAPKPPERAPKPRRGKPARSRRAVAAQPEMRVPAAPSDEAAAGTDVRPQPASKHSRRRRKVVVGEHAEPLETVDVAAAATAVSKGSGLPRRPAGRADDPPGSTRTRRRSRRGSGTTTPEAPEPKAAGAGDEAAPTAAPRSRKRDDDPGRTRRGRRGGRPARNGADAETPPAARRTRKRQPVDAEEAWGEGRPRLVRRMEIVHLP